MTDLERSEQLLAESRQRRTCRQFLPDPVDIQIIRNCIMTAATAPNGADKQPWHFCLVTDPAVKQKIREQAEEVEKDFYTNRIPDAWRADLAKLATNWSKPFLTEAPCLIVIFAEYYKELPDGTNDKNYYVPESVGIATGMLINAIRNAGLSSLTYTPAPMNFLCEMFGRPKGERCEMVLVCGKPDPAWEKPVLTKKSYEEIVDEY